MLFTSEFCLCFFFDLGVLLSLSCILCLFLKEYARAEGVSAGFGVDLESASDLSRGIRVSETAECWEKVQRASARPHVEVWCTDNVVHAWLGQKRLKSNILRRFFLPVIR